MYHLVKLQEQVRELSAQVAALNETHVAPDAAAPLNDLTNDYQLNQPGFKYNCPNKVFLAYRRKDNPFDPAKGFDATSIYDAFKLNCKTDSEKAKFITWLAQKAEGSLNSPAARDEKRRMNIAIKAIRVFRLMNEKKLVETFALQLHTDHNSQDGSAKDYAQQIGRGSALYFKGESVWKNSRKPTANIYGDNPVRDLYRFAEYAWHFGQHWMAAEIFTRFHDLPEESPGDVSVPDIMDAWLGQ